MGKAEKRSDGEIQNKIGEQVVIRLTGGKQREKADWVNKLATNVVMKTSLPARTVRGSHHQG